MKLKSTLKNLKITEEKYLQALGRRKSAVARVRLYSGRGFIVNEKELPKYFLDKDLVKVAEAPLVLIGDKAQEKFKITVMVNGGGKRGQAEAIRLGLARALQMFEKENRPVLKRAGYLKRDARVKERKKYGLKRARRAPQFSKR